MNLSIFQNPYEIVSFFLRSSKYRFWKKNMATKFNHPENSYEWYEILVQEHIQNSWRYVHFLEFSKFFKTVKKIEEIQMNSEKS